MSDTPRTDKHFEGWGVASDYDIAARSLSEQLERELADLKAQHAWRTIETAPKDGTEIWVYLPTCGALLARWIAPCEFLTEDELDGIVNPEESDWFCADFIQGGRLTDGQPTHWQPLPEPPKGCAE